MLVTFVEFEFDLLSRKRYVLLFCIKLLYILIVYKQQMNNQEKDNKNGNELKEDINLKKVSVKRVYFNDSAFNIECI